MEGWSKAFNGWYFSSGNTLLRMSQTNETKKKLNFHFDDKELFFKRCFMLSFLKQAKKARLQTVNLGSTA